MFREISTKSGIFQKKKYAAKFYIFSREICCALPITNVVCDWKWKNNTCSANRPRLPW